MARGKSGRVVLEISPVLKRQIYFELEKKQLTLKEWFIQEANKLLRNNKRKTSETQIVVEDKVTD